MVKFLGAASLFAAFANAALRSDDANVYYCPLDSCLGLKHRDTFMAGPQAGMYDCFDVNTGKPIELSPAVWNGHWNTDFPGERDMGGYLVEPFDYADALSKGLIPPTFENEWLLATECCNEFLNDQCETVVDLDFPSRGGECPDLGWGGFGICVHECSLDTDCNDGKLCCSNGCGHQCMAPKPASKCPKVEEGMFGICLHECYSNEECDLGEECCSNGCGKVCTKVDDEPSKCPKLPGNSFGICIHECEIDDDCDEGKACCSNGCGHQCMDEVVEKPCDACVNRGGAFSTDRCLDSCDFAPLDVGCYTTAAQCEEYREIKRVEKVCEAAGSEGCATCLDAHDDCVFDSNSGDCYNEKALWFLPIGAVDDCSLAGCSSDEECSPVGMDPCAHASCIDGFCAVYYIACMMVPEVCPNTNEYAIIDPLQCCGFLPCEAMDVCYVDAPLNEIRDECEKRGKAIGERCEVRGKGKGDTDPQCRLPRCNDVTDLEKCDGRMDCYVKETNQGKLRCRNRPQRNE